MARRSQLFTMMTLSGRITNMKILLLSLLLLSGCVHKTLVKNCVPTTDGSYWVCDNVLYK
jgi:hypothetical protein